MKKESKTGMFSLLSGLILIVSFTVCVLQPTQLLGATQNLFCQNKSPENGLFLSIKIEFQENQDPKIYFETIFENDVFKPFSYLHVKREGPSYYFLLFQNSESHSQLILSEKTGIVIHETLNDSYQLVNEKTKVEFFSCEFDKKPFIQRPEA